MNMTEIVIMLFGMNGTEEEGNMAKMKLPERIYKIINDESYKTDDIGMSLASVQIYKDKVLKIQEYINEQMRRPDGVLR